MKTLVALLIPLTTTAALTAAEPDWRPVVTKLLKTERPGYGGLCGIVVDRGTGDVFINLSDRGVYRSTDQGRTWRHVSKTPPKGRTESPGCLLIDPTGKTKTMVTALVYGAPIAVSKDSGETFRYGNGKSRHIDWCAVDWTDSRMRFVLALKHEAGGLLIASNDGGKTFRDVGKRFISGWVFDNRTAVVAKEGSIGSSQPTLQRTTNGGKTFRTCGNFTPVGRQSARALPKWRDGNLYWLTKQGLIVTADKGATWKTISAVKGGLYGPVFGRTAKHLFVLTRAGIVESTDGGSSWSRPIAAPKMLKGLAGLTWLDYDPRHDVLYLMKMTSDLYCLRRGK
jgi:BNR/Asp-box repeat